MVRRQLVLLAAVIAVAASVAATQRTLRVPGQFQTINAAIQAAQPNDTVLVSPGTYREQVLLDRDITLKSAGGPFVTTIDAQGGGGVVFGGGVSAANVEGFTITNGTIGIVSGWNGGTIRGNRIVGNSGGWTGAGISAGGGWLLIVDNYIANNIARDGGGIYTGEEGGRHTILRNTIVGNLASLDGGGIYASSENNTGTMAQNTLLYNHAGRNGGGVYFEPWNTDFDNNVVVGNRAGVYGGGIYHAGTTLPVNPMSHCTVAFNSAGAAGGGVAVDHFGILENSIYWGNSAPIGKEIVKLGAGTLLLQHDVVDGGQLSVSTLFGSPFTTLTWGFGMTAANPQFVDAVAHDVHLQATSPAIDVAPTLAYPTDFEGNARVGPPDLGADEFAPQLYAVGDSRPGKAFAVRFVGVPGRTALIGISTTAGRRATPVTLPGVSGQLLLPDPIQVLPIGQFPATGVISLTIAVPAAFPVPTPFVAQGLVGTSLTAPLDVWIN